MLSENVSRIRVRFSIEGIGALKGELIRFLAPKTIDALLRLMPLNGIIALKEGMIYFGTQVKTGSEKPKTQVDAGTIAYWPMGSSVCIFLKESKPYSSVNVVGRVTESLEILKNITSGKRVRMERI